jgi:hypothetical protein
MISLRGLLASLASYPARISAFAYTLLCLLWRAHASSFPVTQKYSRMGDTKRLRTYEADGISSLSLPQCRAFWLVKVQRMTAKSLVRQEMIKST